jgi:hypothetical protein
MLAEILLVIKQWWKGFTMSNEERYLSQSIDHGDLENRIRRLEYQRHQNTLFSLNNGGLG